tara:strand:- start:1645 stop:1860 length:216 start_codon:yes stop_codon:yes gene_type:complete
MGFSTGSRAAKRAQKQQTLMIQKQRQRDELELAESESELARRKNLANQGGRSLFVKTSESGIKSNNLAGTK